MAQDSRSLIVALNLYILTSIVEVAKEDISDAMLRFGIDRMLAEKLSRLNIPSILEIAERPSFLFSVDQKTISDAIKDRNEGQGYRSMHEQIIYLSSAIRKEKVEL